MEMNGFWIAAVVVWFVVGILFASVVGDAAERKGGNYKAWFWLALFFLIPAAIMVMLMDDKRPSTNSVPPATVPQDVNIETRPCPYCDEPIRAAALKCKHCGEFLQPAS